jgi:hypothetical protein
VLAEYGLRLFVGDEKPCEKVVFAEVQALSQVNYCGNPFVSLFIALVHLLRYPY